MNVRDLHIYQYAIALLEHELPPVVTPLFGPAFRPERLIVQVSDGEPGWLVSVAGPAVNGWHPSRGEPQSHSEGSSPWPGEIPPRVRAELAAQMREDARHLLAQADLLRSSADRSLHSSDSADLTIDLTVEARSPHLVRG